MGKRWIGRWVVAVAVLHAVIGLMAFAPVLQAMMGDGLWNSVGVDVTRALAMWFLLGGGFMLVCGLAIDACERSAQAPSLRSTGWGLLVVTLVTIALVPTSGAWLLLPPAIAMVLPRKAA